MVGTTGPNGGRWRALWAPATPDSRSLEANARLVPGEFFRILAPLLAMAATIQVLAIEQQMGLPTLTWICLAGFSIYQWLPLALRLPFFFLLNVVALGVLFGIPSTLATIGLGLALFLAASLPADGRYRLALVLCIGLYLALVKAGITGDGVTYQASGILGGLFMFRIILYLHELQHETAPVPFWKRISYFFLPPNLIFQLFPIVDYKTFVRGYYALPAAATCRRGMHWIGTGILHLLAYRLLYHYGIPDPEELDRLPDLLQYLVSNYALIIRLSGIFHLCAGMVCLFGFDLPRTFDNYFLASSFSDLWRRINCYWRNFVMKVFYFPIYFRFKHRGRTGIFVTVILVFAVNFLLHTYQWFWIRGSVQVTQTDMLFWGILGILLAINSILPSKRLSPTAKTSYSHKAAAVRALKTLGVFTAMCLLWSLWTSGTVRQWWSLFDKVSTPSAAEIASLLATVVTLVGLGMFAQYAGSRRQTAARAGSTAYLENPVFATVVFALLLSIGSEPVNQFVRDRWHFDLATLRSDALSERDQDLIAQGYYEELIVTNNITSRVWELRAQETKEDRLLRYKAEVSGRSPEEISRLLDAAGGKSSWAALKEAGYLQYTGDAMRFRFMPDQVMTFGGVVTTTNRYGMRDRDYTLEKPAGTYRIALLGGSPELGLGVEDDLTVDNVLEDRLTRSGLLAGYDRVEVLNFAAGEYGLLEQVAVTEKLVGDFTPDTLMLFIHDVNVFGKLRKKVAGNMVRARRLEYPKLQGLARELGIDATTSLSEAKRRLQPYELELFSWGLDTIADYCRVHDIRFTVVFVGVMRDREKDSVRNREELLPLLRREDLLLLNLQDVFEGHDKTELIIAPWDLHPNREGHALVADRLFHEMQGHLAYFTGPAGGSARATDKGVESDRLR